jgi:hypothetical protein
MKIKKFDQVLCLHEQVYQVQQMLLRKNELIIRKIFDVIKNVD